MKFDNNNDVLTLYLSGRIDANNSVDIDAEISDILAKNPGLVPKFDASELGYISSAGLRVLLKYRKQFGKNLDVLNVSSEVYDIFEVTGFTELLNVKKRLREISVDGFEVIGGGFESTVYRIDSETIVKVFTIPTATPAAVEKDRIISREVFLHDIPTAISYDVVKAGDKYGLVYEMIDADTVSGTLKRHPERLEELSVKMARLMKKLHTTEFKPGIFPDVRNFVHKLIAPAFSKGLITADDKALIDGLIDRVPYRNTFIHLGYHPKNVMLSNNELVLIDVGDAGLGNPIFDLMMTYAHMAFFDELNLGNADVGHEQIIGLDHKTLSEMWQIMMPEYFGTSDTETLRSYEEIIREYVMIFGLFIAGTASLPEDKSKSLVSLLMEKIRKAKSDPKIIEGI